MTEYVRLPPCRCVALATERAIIQMAHARDAMRCDAISLSFCPKATRLPTIRVSFHSCCLVVKPSFHSILGVVRLEDSNLYRSIHGLILDAEPNDNFGTRSHAVQLQQDTL